MPTINLKNFNNKKLLFKELTTPLEKEEFTPQNIQPITKGGKLPPPPPSPKIKGDIFKPNFNPKRIERNNIKFIF